MAALVLYKSTECCHASPLSLGNGEFAFTADVTGLQTFPRLCSEGQSELFNWLRENPHRLHLDRISVRLTVNASC